MNGGKAVTSSINQNSDVSQSTTDSARNQVNHSCIARVQTCNINRTTNQSNERQSVEAISRPSDLSGGASTTLPVSTSMGYQCPTCGHYLPSKRLLQKHIQNTPDCFVSSIHTSSLVSGLDLPSGEIIVPDNTNPSLNNQPSDRS